MAMQLGNRGFGSPPSNMLVTGGKLVVGPGYWVLEFDRTTYGRILRIDGRAPPRVKVQGWESSPGTPTAPVLGGFQHPITKMYTWPAGLPQAWNAAVRGG